MVKHNNALVKNHFRKDWEQHIKTWFQQPARKVKRRLRRKEKAAKLFPRPTEHLRPLIRCPTLRYNTKIRLGRGFSLDELKLAKIPPMQAKSIGIAIDWRRKNRSLETQRSNVQRLQLYKSKVVVFPKRKLVKAKKPKKGEAKPATAAEPKYKKSPLKLFTVGTAQEEEKSKQLKHQFPYTFPKQSEPPRAITEKEKTDSAYLTLRSARGKQRKVGDKIRKERAAALGVPSTAKKVDPKAAAKGADDDGDDEEGGGGKGKKGKK